MKLIAGYRNGWGASAKTCRKWRYWLLRELNVPIRRGRPRKQTCAR